MKKKALSLLLVLAMCLTLLPTAALAANEPLDGTKGINITSSNMEDVTWTDGSGGTASWSRSTQTLTLNNYKINTGSIPALTVSCGIFFDLKGTNSFISDSEQGAIDITKGNCNLNLGGYKNSSGFGSGTLTVDGGSHAAIYGFNRYNTFRVSNSVAVTLKSTGNGVSMIRKWTLHNTIFGAVRLKSTTTLS